MKANDIHAHLDHQPKPPTEHRIPTEDELQEAFAKTIAVILAFDEGYEPLKVFSDDLAEEPVICKSEGNGPIVRPLQEYQGAPLIQHAIDLIHDCCFDACYVLTKNAEIATIATKSDARTIPFERSDSFKSEHDGTNRFEIVGITRPILDLCTRLAQECEGCDQVFVLRCDNPRLTPWHLLQLHNELASDQDCEIVTSWITWARRLPVLMTLDFLEHIDALGLDVPQSEACPWRPLPNLPLTDVVFGEERLEANATTPAQVADFMKEQTLSALQAVRLARAWKAASPASIEEKDDKAQIEERVKSFNVADKLLFDTACTVVDDRDDALSHDSAFERSVEFADALAKREKDSFPIFNTKENQENLVYLDTAATAQRLGCALDAEYRFNAYENANIYRGAYKLSAEATATFNDARATIERFINADRRQTIFTMNATQSLNLVASAWGNHNIHEGDHILTAINEHHSDILPWMLLAKRTGAHLHFIGMRADGTLDMDDYEKLLELRPKLVCVAHISNVIGIKNPVREMAKMAHEAGARFVVDAAQSAPHIKIDVKALDADFVAFSGHKLYGPFGIGCLWVAPDAFCEMDPIGAGGGTVSHASTDSYYLRQGAIQYELGTPPIAQAVGLAQACSHLETIGFDAIEEHDRILTRYLMEGLRKLDFATVWGDHDSVDGQNGLVALSIAGIDAGQIGAFMGTMGVAVRSGGHCALPLAASMGLSGTTRISFGIHTTSEDIDAALVALRVCARSFGASNNDASA